MADFDPTTEGPLATAHRPRWQLETDVAEMTLDVLSAGTYLPPFSAQEHADDYRYRKQMSACLDICRDAVQIRMDNLWRTPPKRSVEGAGKHRELVARLIDDCDGDGTSLDAFMRRVVWNHYVTGVDVVTQMSAVPEGQLVATLADQERLGLYPYFMQFSPLERVDWAVNGSRNFLWARYCLGERPKLDERDGGDGSVSEYLTVGRDGWRLWRVSTGSEVGQDGKPAAVRKVELVGEGPHLGLSRPPIVKAYFAESQKPGQGGVPLGLLTRPAVVAKVAMNLKSQADAELLAAVPRWLATGFAAGELPDTYGGGVLISANDAAATMSVIQGDVSHIVEKRAWLLLYIGEMLRLLKFRGGMAEIAANTGSGLKLAIERTDLDNELRATASQFERIESEMVRQAVVLATGKPIAPERAADELGYSVTYNRDFVLEPVGELLENLATWIKQCGWAPENLPEITREMTRQLANMLAREGTPPYEAMIEQIDTAELTGGGNDVLIEEPEPATAA